MGKFDVSSLRTPQDLERKYNFNSMKVAIEASSKQIIKTNNELDNILNSLVISLENVLDSQSDISLWFYSGTPTTSNEPYTNWIDPTEHYGDLYYDQSTGYVYQYNENKGWELQVDPNLIQSLAITNSETDTTDDHERKVMFSTPSPPYSNGDWWIKEDSSLYVCQITKTSEQTYEENDWIGINDYTDSVATKIEDVLTVIKGSVTIINDSYAKFTDLATGGSTIIDGANIKTGTIDARQVRIENNNVIIDGNGIKMSNGAKLVSEYGLYSNLQFSSGNEFEKLGFICYMTDGFHRTPLNINVYIPNGFVITDARVTLYLKPQHINYNKKAIWGYSRALKLYKSNNDSEITTYISSEIYYTDPSGTEITNAFNKASYTPTTPTDSNHTCQVVTSKNIKDSLKIGNNNLLIYSSLNYTSSTINGESPPTSIYYGTDGDDYLAAKYTGYGIAYVNIYGYMNVENL